MFSTLIFAPLKLLVRAWPTFDMGVAIKSDVIRDIFCFGRFDSGGVFIVVEDASKSQESSNVAFPFPLFRFRYKRTQKNTLKTGF